MLPLTQMRLIHFVSFVAIFMCIIIQLSTSAVLAPVFQDPSTRLYSLSLYLKTTQQPIKLLLDLGASSVSWVECGTKPSPSIYHPVPCASPLCTTLLNSSVPYDVPPISSCSNGSCLIFFASRPGNPKKSVRVQALVDTLAVPITDGRNPGQLRVVSNFVFSCSKRSLVKGLVARGVTGLAALGRSKFSLAAQVSTFLSDPKVFALCLSGSPSAPGVAFLGTRGPYFFLPEIDLSKDLNYTPLLFSSGGHHGGAGEGEYLIGLTSIKVNGRVAVNLSRVVGAVDESGFGGTKLSLSTPYTVLQSSIYANLVDVFANESLAALGLTATQPVSPFGMCYDEGDVVVTRAGPAVPSIDLVMQNEEVFWRILGWNSMIRMTTSEGIPMWCLAFVDGGEKPKSQIIIGGHQMVDNLLQFDLNAQKLGFSSSVLQHNTMCANFNFTVNTSLT